MATYNRSHFIEEMLNSILNQSFWDWECIIIDDGSSDNTFEIIKSYSGLDQRFKYYKRTEDYKKGLPGCRNMGLDLAKGNFIQFFDDDDIVHPKNLETSLKGIKNSPNYFCRYDKKPFTGKWEVFKLNEVDRLSKKDFGLKDLPDMVIGKIPFASCTVLWDKKCFENLRFNENLMYGEEWECYSRILSMGFKGISIDHVLYYNRKHPGSNTGEFWNKEKSRIKSYEIAAILIIENLGNKNLLNSTLKKFFIRLGFMLNSSEILRHILNATNSGKSISLNIF